MRTLAIFSIIIFSIFVSTQSFAQYSGGNGTQSNPFQIKYVKDLITLSDSVMSNNKYANTYFKMLNDISFKQGPIDSSQYFTPIGGFSNPSTNDIYRYFSGIFEGNGHVIKNLIINKVAFYDIGFFGRVKNSIICDLGIDSSSISGYSRIGGLIGNADGNNIIRNVYSKDSVNGESFIGGLIGRLYNSTLINSYSISSLNGYSDIGGLVGSDPGGKIKYSYSASKITSTTSSNIGGLIGTWPSHENIEHSFFLLFPGINGSGDNFNPYGQMIGLSSSNFKTNCSVVSQLNNFKYSGSWRWVGDTTINNGYPILYWQNGADTNNSDCWNGQGSINNPYNINYTKDIIVLSDLVMKGAKYDSTFFKVQNDINFKQGIIDSSIYFTPIGGFKDTVTNVLSNVFRGNFDGNGHVIKSLTINKPNLNYIGFFGAISNATISNIGMDSCSIIGKDYCAALVGVADTSNINNSFSNSFIQGNDNVGGLVGYSSGLLFNKDYNTFNNIYSNSIVNGRNYVGGIAGFCSHNVYNSYSASKINKSGTIFGTVFIGCLDGVAYNSYHLKTSWDKSNKSKEFPLEYLRLNCGFASQLCNFSFSGMWKWVNDTTINNGYPILSWQNGGNLANCNTWDGQGTKNSPYQVKYVKDLISISKFAMNGANFKGVYFKLINNIDFKNGGNDSSSYFTPIGGFSDSVTNTLSSFSGIFDGCGFLIKNLTINRPSNDNVSIFGRISNASICNIGVDSCSYIGKNNVGGLVGSSFTDTIFNCFSSSIINGNNNIGGLVGYSNGKISNCYSNSTINGNMNIGGIVGMLYGGRIINSYSVPILLNSIAQNQGLLVGSSSYGQIINSYVLYSIGKKSVGTGDSTGVFQKITNELRSSLQVGLLNANQYPRVWKWVNDTIKNNGYPILYWQIGGYYIITPKITIDSAINITCSSAELKATLIDSSNLAKYYGFEYKNYLDTSWSIIYANSNVNFQSNISNLNQNSEYNYRAFIRTDSDTIFSDTNSFVTSMSKYDTIYATICKGQIYNLHGFNADSIGVYTQNLQTYNGCDSIISLNLFVYPSYSQTLFDTICQGQLYNNYGFSFIADTTGLYTQNLQTIDGCDSIINLNLVVVAPSVPANVTTNLMQDYIELVWEGNAVEYDIYRDDSLVANTSLSNYIDSNLVDSVEYCYKVKARIDGCESEFSEPTCKTFVGLQDIKSDTETSVYPNPTTNRINFYVKQNILGSAYTITNTIGEVILNGNLNISNMSIDLSKLPKGLYFMNIEKTHQSIKIIKQ